MAALSEALKKEIEEVKTHYPVPRGAVMPALHRIKRECGRLTPEIMRELSLLLGVPPLQVEEVASFYPLFQQNEGARHTLHVCVTLSCHLCGCEALLEHLGKRYGLKPGGVTSDGRLALHEAQCLGSCGTAPAILVDLERHENVTPERLDDLIAGLDGGEEGTP